MFLNRWLQGRGEGEANTLLETPNNIRIKNSNCQPASLEPESRAAFVPAMLGAGLFMQGCNQTPYNNVYIPWETLRKERGNKNSLLHSEPKGQ